MNRKTRKKNYRHNGPAVVIYAGMETARILARKAANGIQKEIEAITKEDGQPRFHELAELEMRYDECISFIDKVGEAMKYNLNNLSRVLRKKVKRNWQAALNRMNRTL